MTTKTTTQYVAQDSINGPLYTDYTLASGHTITVRNRDGRVMSGAWVEVGDLLPAEAHPDLFEMVRVGRSMYHDDHYVFLPAVP